MNRRKQYIIALCLGALALPLIGSAQHAPPDEVAEDIADAVPAIALADVLRRAQSNPPSVLVAYAEYRAAQARSDYAAGAWLPSLRAEASGGYSYDKRRLLANLPSIGSQSLHANGELRLEWVALDVARGGRIDAADAAERARRFDVDSARSRAAFQAAELYLRAGAAIELVRDARLSLRRRQDQYQATTELVKAGTRSPVDAQRARIEVVSAEYVLSLRRTEQLATFAALASALGRPASELLRPATTSADFAVDADNPGRARQLAAANRPELRSAAANAAAQLKAHDAAIGERWPILGAAATGNASQVDVRSGAGIEGLQYGGSGLAFMRWNGLDPAVWMRGSVSEAAAQVADRDRSALAHAIESEAVRAYYALERARTEHRRAVAVLEAAQVTREAQNGRYLAGLGSLLELLDAEDLEQRVRQQRIEAQRDEAIASAQLQWVCGLLVR